MNINRVELSGNVTRDAELRATQGGTAVCVFGIAFNDRKRNQQTGEWEDVPNFADVVIYGKYAEGVAKHITKGRKLFLSGKLHYSSWVKDGAKRSKLEVVADAIDIAGEPKQAAQTQQQAPAQAQPVYSAPPAAPAPVQGELYDEEMPF